MGIYKSPIFNFQHLFPFSCSLRILFPPLSVLLHSYLLTYITVYIFAYSILHYSCIRTFRCMNVFFILFSLWVCSESTSYFSIQLNFNTNFLHEIIINHELSTPDNHKNFYTKLLFRKQKYRHQMY